MAEVVQTNNLSDAILNLVERTENLLSHQSSNPSQRILVALAGVPGSGKSTVSQALLEELASRGVSDVVVVPMVC
jgi:adenylylsulfate kinase-like enzyme